MPKAVMHHYVVQVQHGLKCSIWDLINVVYISALQLFCSPFVVVLDHKKKALVIAIRGTLSMEVELIKLPLHFTHLT